MKIKSLWLQKCLGLTVSAAVRAWMSTLDYQVSFADPTVDPVNPRFSGQKIFVFWHEYILFPLYLRGHTDLAILVSQHGDADILGHVAHHMGFHCVRGSTTRGGATALRELLTASRRMNLAIAPDGPRGPRRRLALGPIFLASKLGLPLVATGFGYERPWRVGSWDRFAIPRPGSKARAVMSAGIEIPAGLDREGLEAQRTRVEDLLNALTLSAENWATAGTQRPGQQPFRRQPAARRLGGQVEQSNLPSAPEPVEGPLRS